MTTGTITMEMLGFGCASCVYTIEKLGRKIDGVDKISASLAEQRVRIEHHGSREEIIAKISDIVKRIGHELRELPEDTGNS